MIRAILDGKVDEVQGYQKERPHLWPYVRDFLLMLTVPNAFDFRAQDEKWRRAIRTLSEGWHIGYFFHLRNAPREAVQMLFPKNAL